jgi:aminopeptidase N
VSNTLQLALTLDSPESSHAVELVIQDPSEANQILDDISYE